MSELKEPSSLLYLKKIASELNRRPSLTHAAIEVLIDSKRPYEISGKDNLPDKGGFILVANHFVRVEDKESMTGPRKMNDMFETMGLLAKVLRDKIGETANVVWTPSEVPRPEAVLPEFRGKPREVLKRIALNAGFAATNATRAVFLKLFSNATDILSVPPGIKNLRTFLGKAKQHIEDGDVIALFPEGEVSYELRTAHEGFAFLAMDTQAAVLPVAVYDEGGSLKMIIGQLIPPPGNRSERHDFTDKVMHVIAGNLPMHLRGQYNIPG